jgi:hypothetical protein
MSFQADVESTEEKRVASIDLDDLRIGPTAGPGRAG